MDKQDVPAWNFNAVAQLVRNVAGHRRDNGRCLEECGLEFGAGRGAHIQNRDFKYLG